MSSLERGVDRCQCTESCLCRARHYLLEHFPGTTLREQHHSRSHSFAIVDHRGVSLRQLVLSDRLTIGDEERVQRLFEAIELANRLRSHNSEPMYLEATEEFVRLRNSLGETVLRVQDV